ncbi:prospero homeobox protein 1-like [Aplochiton taeniatus]
MHSSGSNINFCTAGQFLPFHHHEDLYDSTLSSNSEGSHASVLLSEGIENDKMSDKSHYGGDTLSSTLTNSCLMNLKDNSSNASTFGSSYLTSGAGFSGGREWTLGSGHHAKRARVENIIRSMSGSPRGVCTGDVELSKHETEALRGNRQQASPLLQDPIQEELTGSSGTRDENQALQKQLHTMQKLLTHLQAKVFQVYERSESQGAASEESYLTGDTWKKDWAETSPNQLLIDPCCGHKRSSEKMQVGWKKTKLLECIPSDTDKDNTLFAYFLKKELSRAVNSSVDFFFKDILPSLRMQPENRDTKADNQILSGVCERSSVYRDGTRCLSPCSEMATSHAPEIQTEALSLVVEKPSKASMNLANMARKKSHPIQQPPLLYNDQTEHQDDEILESVSHQNLSEVCPYRHATDQSAREIVNFHFPWNPVKVRSKVTSRPIRSPHFHPVTMDHIILDNLCLPHVKIECDSLQGLVKSNTYVLNEGLTTNHLKKAKLMFLYSRYPSSTMLKTFFSDVQFTRCVTSQLIKWFSNFREFYYIQMEKFARHAIMEGVTNVRDLTVGRESELFRALNMHYNKANDFQVPERFLEVAEITLKEFYIAISMGKDSDPSWKKAIYKVICKMDSVIPADFKSQSSAQE